MNSDSELNTMREGATTDALAEAKKGGVIVAVLIIAAGVILLLNQLGMLPERFLATFWPALFIITGFVQLVGNRGWQRVQGGGLVLVGLLLQLNTLGILHFRIWDLWPLVVIAAGAALLWNILSGKPMITTPHSKLSEFNATYVFSGTDRKVEVKDFRGGKISAVFGGFKIDLTRSALAADEVVLQVDAVFGGGEIIVPESWAVIVEGAGVFGAFEDQTLRPSEAQAAKVLRVTGAAVFGGVVVRNPR